MKDLISDFLAQKKIAVAGVSRQGDVPANVIYKKLRSSGYQVFALNPHAIELEGDACYPDLSALPERVDALVIATRPDQAVGLIRQCQANGVARVWFHRSVGQGSYNDEAAGLGREFGIKVISGGCPMMYCQPVDIFHKCLRWMTRYPKL